MLTDMFSATQQRATFTALLILMFVSMASAAPMNFTVYSQPVRLRYGQVINRRQDMLALPDEVVKRYENGKKTMALTGFDVDMVRAHQDGETQVKLSDHYLHHYILSMGRASTLQKVFETPPHSHSAKQMMTGCHGMKQVGMRSITDKLAYDSPHAEQDFKTFGSAAGAEYRDNPQRFEAPYRMLLYKPEVWAPVLHIINTKHADRNLVPANSSYSPLLECPCTPQRKFDIATGTIDGRTPFPPFYCSPQFAATGNPSCQLSTYVGGWRCCEDNVFLIDTDKECSDPNCSEESVDEVFMKFTFYYEDATRDMRDMESAACCDATSTEQGDANIEYDVPVCPPGTPAKLCVHVVETVQPLAYFNHHPLSPWSRWKASALVDLVFAAPHMHVAGISLELIDHMTNTTLCEVHQTADNTAGLSYGNGSAPGNENGYLVGISTCKWGGGKAPRFRRNHPMRTRAVYNASRHHTGVMSLWLMDVAPVKRMDVFV